MGQQVTPWVLAVKRAFDLLVSAFLGIVLVPPMALIAFAIAIESRGPILFAQYRLGRNGRTFRCWKYRTMYTDADERLRDYLERHPESRSDWERYAKLRSYDPRLTRIGVFLRRFSLDELPQLANIVLGDMSLVGPRPYMTDEAARMGEHGAAILQVPPGLTGLWQVSGRNELSFEQRLRLDVQYVRNRSLWSDIRVLLKTPAVVLGGRGAY